MLDQYCHIHSNTGACSNCVDDSKDVKVNLSDEGGWIPYITNKIILDGTTEPLTEDTTVETAISITIAVVVGILIICVIIIAAWLFYGMYCRRLRGSMFTKPCFCQALNSVCLHVMLLRNYKKSPSHTII